MYVLGASCKTERVGGNVVRYGSVAPSCEQVQGEAACYNFWASARARELARQPKHPLMPPYAFVGNWFWSSFGNITDIQTQWWRHQVKPARWLTPLLVTMLTLGVLYGIVYEKARWAKNQVSRWRTYVGLIALYYIGVNLAVNYSTYLSLRVYGIALNGRYIIPSVLVLAVLSCFYWAKLLRKRPVILAALAIAIILATIFASGLLMMLRNPQLYRG